jgi:hypothetical protein
LILMRKGLIVLLYAAVFVAALALKADTIAAFDLGANAPLLRSLDMKLYGSVCVPPASGDWTITAGTTCTCNAEAWRIPANVHVYGTLDMQYNCTLVFDNATSKIYVYSGGKVYVGTGSSFNTGWMNDRKYRIAHNITGTTRGAQTDYWTNIRVHYVNSNMSATLASYMKMEEGAGLSTHDSSGSGDWANLTGMANPPTATSGWNNTPEYCKVGRGCIYFDGSDDYLNFSQPIARNPPYTVSVWVKPVSISDGAYHYIATNGGYTGSIPGFFLLLTNGEQWQFGARDAAGYYGYTQIAAADAAWTHLAGAWDGTYGANSVRLYVNGVKYAVTPTSVGAVSTVQNLFVGAYTTGGVYKWSGAIDELRIYNRSLSDAEISNLYKMGYDVGASGPDVAADKCMGNFTDLRFTNSTGVPLDYWIAGNTTNGTADVWVKVGSIPASPGNATVYVYYDNATLNATSQSNNTLYAIGTDATAITYGAASSYGTDAFRCPYDSKIMVWRANPHVAVTGFKPKTMSSAGVVNSSSSMTYSLGIGYNYINVTESMICPSNGMLAFYTPGNSYFFATNSTAWYYSGAGDVAPGGSLAASSTGYMQSFKVWLRRYANPEPTHAGWGAEETKP